MRFVLIICCLSLSSLKRILLSFQKQYNVWLQWLEIGLAKRKIAVQLLVDRFNDVKIVYVAISRGEVLPLNKLCRRLSPKENVFRAILVKKWVQIVKMFMWNGKITDFYNGNRTDCSPIRSVIIGVINKIGLPRSGFL